MNDYGYQILQALITDLDPDQRVKNAMNEINSSKRLKYAVGESFQIFSRPIVDFTFHTSTSLLTLNTLFITPLFKAERAEGDKILQVKSVSVASFS
jgi:hypothetical protein